MKRVIFLFLTLLFANENEIYLNYAHKLIEYHFEIKNLNTIKAPFEIEKNLTNKIIVSKPKELKKVVEFELLSIFNNEAYILIKHYIGNILKKKRKIWVKKGDKINNCKVVSITFGNVVLKCKNKKIKLSLYKKIPGLKEKK